MNEKFNLIEILKNVPIGTKLYSPVCGECEFDKILFPDNKFAIIECRISDNHSAIVCFSSDGRYCNYDNGECMLFPSKNNRDWAEFKAPKKHKEFKTFEKVLFKKHVGYCRKAVWMAAEYSHYDEDLKKHFCTNGYGVTDDKILPYAGNENIVGKEVEY